MRLNTAENRRHDRMARLMQRFVDQCLLLAMVTLLPEGKCDPGYEERQIRYNALVSHEKARVCRAKSLAQSD